MLITVFLLFTFTLSVKGSSTMTCDGLSSGYYCIDSSRYAWCYGQSTPTVLSCGAGLSCLCGKTASNPCGWSWSTISDCSGRPGDFIGSSSPKPPNPTPPVTEPSESSESLESGGNNNNNNGGSGGGVVGSDDRKVIGYFDSWSQYHLDSIDGVSCRFMPENINPKYFTHINYAFAVMNDRFDVTTYEWNDEDFYTKLQAFKVQYLSNITQFNSIRFNSIHNTNYTNYTNYIYK